MILVVGSVGFDNVQTPFGKVKNVLGGSASYFSISASFFTPVNLVAVVGSNFKKKHHEIFQKHNVDLTGLQKIKGKTFRWYGKYEHDLNVAHTIKTQLNVFENFNPEIPTSYKNIKYVFLANIDPELQYEVLSQVNSPEMVACDTMNLWIEKKRQHLIKLLKKVNIFIINEAEARQLSEEVNLLKAAQKILSLGPQILVIKRGEYGVMFFTCSSIFTSPGFPLETIFDPTGAGDSFAGGFLGYIVKSKNLKNKTIRQAIIFGNVMGSFCVEDFSLDRFKRLTYNQITKRFKEFKKITHFEDIS